MHVVDARANLNEKEEGRVLAQVLLFANKVEKVAFARIVQCKVNRLLVLEARIKSKDVLVVQLLLNSYLTN